MNIPFDTRALFVLTDEEREEARRRKLASAGSPEIQEALQREHIAAVKELVDKGTDPKVAERIVNSRRLHILAADTILVFDNNEKVRAAEVRDNIEKYHWRTMPDPLEGFDYGENKAIVINRRSEDGEKLEPIIKSFAHGGCWYTFDIDDIEAAIEKGNWFACEHPEEYAAEVEQMIREAAERGAPMNVIGTDVSNDSNKDVDTDSGFSHLQPDTSNDVEQPDIESPPKEDEPRGEAPKPRSDPPRAEVPKPHLRRKNYEEFCQSYKPPEYFQGQLFSKGYVYFVTGPTFGGKTLWGVTQMHSIATGRDLLGLGEVEPGRVAYVMIENPEDTKKRVIAQRWYYNIDMVAMRDQITVVDEFIFLEKQKPISPLIDAYRQLLADGHEKGGFSAVFIDSLQAAFSGDDFNDNVAMLHLARQCRGFSKLPGNPAVFMLAHPVKNATSDNLVPYGGNAALNEVDGNLTLWNDTGTGIIKHHWTRKFRGGQFEPVSFKVELIQCPDLVDSKGRQFEVPILKTITGEMEESRKEKRQVRLRAVLVVLFDYPRASFRDLLEKCHLAGHRTLESLLKELKEQRLVEEGIEGAGWRLTSKGQKEAKALKKVGTTGDMFSGD